MRRSYLDYAMSVIVSRALPDVRDGLKPVHRRILYAMKENGYDSSKPYRKSARIIGDVMGKYHPHGDTAIYDAMVRMAQEFSMRLPLIDGQGNFGSMDGDPPAAMRYTEARLAKAAEALLDDIDKETIDFRANYDETTSEPTVLPARFPNILVNGGGGIAVGMATNIPPHNLGEVISACLAYIDDPGISDLRLLELVPGPDFPTGGIIRGRTGITKAYTEGRGSVVIRSRTHVEEIRKDRWAIVVTEIPYQVNKSRMLERIAEVVREKLVEGISDLRDESDRDGVRVVVELKRDADSEVVQQQLFRYTPMQTSFGVNMLALDSGKPKMMTLKEIIAAFVAFREEVVTRRTRYELRKARERAHILAGLLVAISNLDPVIELIRAAADPATARASLMEQDWPAHDVEPFIALIDDPGHVVVDGKYRLSEAQARAILELRLQRLTGMERDKLTDETEDLANKIKDLLDILQSRPRRLEVMRGELADMSEQFGTPRRTEIDETAIDADIEDLIQREDMVVTVTHSGYIKRVPLSTYRAQRRGGKGRSGMSTKEDDFVVNVFVTSTHTPVLFFSTRGMVYQLKVYRLPLGSPTTRGKAMVNILPLEEGEQISTVMPLPEDENQWEEMFAFFATQSGNVRRNRLSDFTNIKSNGKIAMKLDDGDRLVAVRTCLENEDIMLATAKGGCIRFRVDDVRVFVGRNSTGVRGIRLAKDDSVIAMSKLIHVETDTETRDAYLRAIYAKRRLAGLEDQEDGDPEKRQEDEARAQILVEEPYRSMEETEEYLLTISDAGYGLLTSAYDYRVTGRGGKGIGNMDLGKSDGSQVIACFPIRSEDELVLVTDGGQLIRVGVNEISPKRRNGMGVRVFDVGDEQRVVSVAHMSERDEEEEISGPDGDVAPVAEVDAETPAEEDDTPPDSGSEQ
jgi:DNA gyrase subunit A